EVTNPPIDPYREGGAMSLTTYLGRSPVVGGWAAGWLGGSTVEEESAAADPGNDPTNQPPSHPTTQLPCRQMELSSPVLNDAAVEEIRRHEVLGFKALSAVFPLRGGKEALREALHRLRSEAERAAHDGYNVLCLSDKEAFTDHLAPVPSLL